MNAVVRRATVEEIVAHRDRALSLYEEAYARLEAAHEALVAAAKAGAMASPGRNRFNHHADAERKSFGEILKLPARADFLATYRRLTDTDVWSAVVAMTELERLMDKKAKDELHQQLINDPPEVTVDNVFATVEQFMLDAGTIFKRGLAEAFSALDRRFRSHDGWKIGSRVILDRAFDDFGCWNYHRNLRDTMQDIERAFFVLDGKVPPANYGGIVGSVEESRRGGGYGPRRSEAQTEYFTVRTFQNGNAHIWFRRDDLVERVNKLLGEYYGAPIPEERDAQDDGGLHEPKTSLAKNYGFFPTPAAAAATLVEAAALRRYRDAPPLTVLEPSAGTGNLARLAVEEGAVVDCVEIHAERADQLRRAGRYRRVSCVDFLALKPDQDRLYDRVVMNPPFDRERDIDHVMHALEFLKTDGRLVAIMSAGTEFRENRKSAAFRALMTKMGARWRDLPAGSFAAVGTYCNTIVLTVSKDGRPVHW